MIDNSPVWVVSDVDGTLMDHSYDLAPAKDTIKILQELSIPVILCTSKTSAMVSQKNRLFGSRTLWRHKY